MNIKFKIVGLALVLMSGLLISGKSIGKSVSVHNMDDYALQQSQILSERLHPIKVEVSEGKFTVLIPSLYGFDTGKSDLSRPMRDKLKSLSQFLNHYNDSQIKIYGHTDSVGDYAYNLKLSGERASTVYENLINNGVNPWRVSVIPESYEVPRCVESSEKSRECNRRVEIEVILEPGVFR